MHFLRTLRLQYHNYSLGSFVSILVAFKYIAFKVYHVANWNLHKLRAGSDVCDLLLYYSLGFVICYSPVGKTVPYSSSQTKVSLDRVGQNMHGACYLNPEILSTICPLLD